MPEVQKTQQSGEVSQRFIEFVMLQGQQARLFLGLGPNSGSGKPEPDLRVARALIDQLEMIREKTRGNLSRDETESLESVLTQLQLGYVQAIEAKAGGPAEPAPETAQESHPEVSS